MEFFELSGRVCLVMDSELECMDLWSLPELSKFNLIFSKWHMLRFSESTVMKLTINKWHLPFVQFSYFSWSTLALQLHIPKSDLIIYISPLLIDPNGNTVTTISHKYTSISHNRHASAVLQWSWWHTCNYVACLLQYKQAKLGCLLEIDTTTLPTWWPHIWQIIYYEFFNTRGDQCKVLQVLQASSDMAKEMAHGSTTLRSSLTHMS